MLIWDRFWWPAWNGAPILKQIAVFMMHVITWSGVTTWSDIERIKQCACTTYMLSDLPQSAVFGLVPLVQLSNKCRVGISLCLGWGQACWPANVLPMPCWESQRYRRPLQGDESTFCNSVMRKTGRGNYCNRWQLHTNWPLVSNISLTGIDPAPDFWPWYEALLTFDATLQVTKYEEAVRSSWVWEELSRVRNFKPVAGHQTAERERMQHACSWTIYISRCHVHTTFTFTPTVSYSAFSY